MKKLIKHLDERNHFLEKFRRLNQTQIQQSKHRNFECFEMFYKAREKILEIISYLEVLIRDRIKGFGPKDKATDEQKNQIREALNRKDDIVSIILDQDLQIISLIEKEKSTIIKELRKTTEGRKIVKSYAGQKRARQLDEKY